VGWRYAGWLLTKCKRKMRMTWILVSVVKHRGRAAAGADGFIAKTTVVWQVSAVILTHSARRPPAAAPEVGQQRDH
jgi:hypothetical protein